MNSIGSPEIKANIERAEEAIDAAKDFLQRIRPFLSY